MTNPRILFRFHHFLSCVEARNRRTSFCDNRRLLVKFTHVVTRFSSRMPRLPRNRVQRVTRLPTESPDRSNFSLVRYVVPAPCQENGDGTVLVLRAFSSIRAAAVERKYQRHVSPREMFLSTESATRLFLTSPTIFLFPPSFFFFRAAIADTADLVHRSSWSILQDSREKVLIRQRWPPSENRPVQLDKNKFAPGIITELPRDPYGRCLRCCLA